MPENNPVPRHLKHLPAFWTVLLIINVGVIIGGVWFLSNIRGLSLDVQSDLNSLRQEYVEASVDLPADSEGQEIIVATDLSSDNIDDILGMIDAAENRALSYLGLFESISFTVTVLGIVVVAVGIIAAVIGVANFSDLNTKMEAARERLIVTEQTIHTRLDELEDIKSDIDDLIIKNLEEQVANQTLINKLNKSEEKIQTTLHTNRQVWSLIALAESDLRQKNYGSAKRSFHRAYEMDQENPTTSYYLGHIALDKDDLDQARQLFESALSLDKDFLQAEASLGLTLRRIGESKEDKDLSRKDFEDARLMLHKVLGQDPDLIDFEGESWHGALAGLYKRLGQLSKAKYHYELALEVTKLSSYPAGNLAELALRNPSQDDDINILYANVKRLAQLEISASLVNYWAHADLLTSSLVLGDSEENIIRYYNNLLDAIPAEVKAVLSRVQDTTLIIKEASSYDGDRRNTALIEHVLEMLNANIADE